MSQRIYADLYIRIMAQILHKKEKELKSKKVHGISAYIHLHDESLCTYLPTLLYLMSSTSKKKQRKFQSSVTCEFLILFLLEHIIKLQASCNQPEQQQK